MQGKIMIWKLIIDAKGVPKLMLRQFVRKHNKKLARWNLDKTFSAEESVMHMI